MTFMEYKNALGKRADSMREGQIFVSWLKDQGHDVNDMELFHCRSDTEAWSIINLRYGKYLYNLS